MAQAASSGRAFIRSCSFFWRSLLDLLQLAYMKAVSQPLEPIPTTYPLPTKVLEPLEVDYFPHAGVFAPTIMVPNFTAKALHKHYIVQGHAVSVREAFESQDKAMLASAATLLDTQFEQWTKALTQEAQEGQWKVTPNRYLLKFNNSTRGAWLLDFKQEDVSTVEFLNKLCSMCLPRTEEQNAVRRSITRARTACVVQTRRGDCSWTHCRACVDVLCRPEAWRRLPVKQESSFNRICSISNCSRFEAITCAPVTCSRSAPSAIPSLERMRPGHALATTFLHRQRSVLKPREK